jgi:hypothetical protein
MALTKEIIEKRVNKMIARDKRRKKERAKNTNSEKKSKSTGSSVNPDKFNRALADVALDKMGYPNQSCPPNDPEVADLAKRKFTEMDCPLMSKTWNCNQVEEDKELEHRFYEKGKEFQCTSGGFVNCPSYRIYFNFRIENRAKQRGKEKEAKRKGT